MLRSMITVSNLHGLAGRLVRAHGTLIGLTPGLELPNSDWVSAQCRARNLGYADADAAKKALQSVKQQTLTDDQVASALKAWGNEHAIDIEQQRRDEDVLTYDDLLRLAELILAHDGVSTLYRGHFGCLIVDEFQDLTPQQLRVVQQIGYGRTTYAVDVAQGIYVFAGADPEAVLATICEETSVELPLTESYRSSPAVLAVVNALQARTGGAELRCAAPRSWPGGGLAIGIAFPTVKHEADWVVAFARRILEAAPTHRVGVIARTGGRRRFLDDAFAATDLTWHRWDDPLMDAATCGHMKKVVSRLRGRNLDPESTGIADLVDIAGVDLLEEPDTRKGVVEALSWMADLLRDGIDLEEIMGRVHAAHSTKLLDAAGIHLLSGHVGKGQQFDWVVVVGLEEGILPNFNAKTSEELREEARVFSVMLSRARHGLAVTRSARVPALSGDGLHQGAFSISRRSTRRQGSNKS
jgi:DNA helicase-2/ATP-dependent DNA helicase PcrA